MLLCSSSTSREFTKNSSLLLSQARHRSNTGNAPMDWTENNATYRRAGNTGGELSLADWLF